MANLPPVLMHPDFDVPASFPPASNVNMNRNRVSHVVQMPVPSVIEEECDLLMNLNGSSNENGSQMVIPPIFDLLPSPAEHNTVPNSVIKKEDRSLEKPVVYGPVSITMLPDIKIIGPSDAFKNNSGSKFTPDFKIQVSNLKNDSSCSAFCESSTWDLTRASHFLRFEKKAKRKADKQRVIRKQQEMSYKKKQEGEKRKRVDVKRQREKKRKEVLKTRKTLREQLQSHVKDVKARSEDNINHLSSVIYESLDKSNLKQSLDDVIPRVEVNINDSKSVISEPSAKYHRQKFQLENVKSRSASVDKSAAKRYHHRRREQKRCNTVVGDSYNKNKLVTSDYRASTCRGSQFGPTIFMTYNQFPRSHTTGKISDDMCLDTTVFQESLVGWPSVFRFRSDPPPIPNMPIVGIRGLKNVASSCWLNSITQIMANQREFKIFSVENFYENCYLDLTVSNGVLAAFAQTVKKIWSFRSDWVLDTSNIRNAIQRRVPSMSPEGAQRLTEAFGLIMHAMREEISTVRSRPILKRSYNAVRSLLGYNVTAPQANANIITHIFNGVYVETITCLNVQRCGVSQTQPYNFYSWPLQLKTRVSVSIVNLFMDSIGIQQSEERQCKECSGAARRTVAMLNFPNCFVMTVGRMNREGQSLVRYTNPVRAPLDWTINTQSEAVTYRLNSFVTEVAVPGSVNHAVTCVRHLDTQRWFVINDETFQEVNSSSFTFENLVLATYSRV